MILKELREQSSGILQIIFSKSLHTGKLPSKWLDANISPIYKKGDRSLPSNYRPISLTCVKGKTLSWIKSFLDNRTQTVVIEGKQSHTAPVTSGVPQGSVLGPILFLAYINDLPDNITSQVGLFADDTVVYAAISRMDDSLALQRDLDTLQTWKNKWDMEFNPSKCQVLQLTRARKPIPTSHYLHNHKLEITDCARYLGVDISQNLSFNNYIDRICNTANKTLGFLRRNL